MFEAAICIFLRVLPIAYDAQINDDIWFLVFCINSACIKLIKLSYKINRASERVLAPRLFQSFESSMGLIS